MFSGSRRQSADHSLHALCHSERSEESRPCRPVLSWSTLQRWTPSSSTATRPFTTDRSRMAGQHDRRLAGHR